jgi:hypothetical protein
VSRGSGVCEAVGQLAHQFNHSTENDGVIVLRLAPIEGGGDPVEIETRVPKGTTENNVADLVSAALRRPWAARNTASARTTAKTS